MRYFIYNSPVFEAYLKESSHVRGEVGEGRPDQHGL